jgi:hypothetical protein
MAIIDPALDKGVLTSAVCDNNFVLAGKADNNIRARACAIV